MKIALSGKMASGKSTVSKLLRDSLGLELISIGSEIKPLANLLIEDEERFKECFKEIKMPKSQRDYKLDKIINYFNETFNGVTWEKDHHGEYIKNRPYRKLLQEFPLIAREKLGEDIFVRTLFDKAPLHPTKSYINDDLRFVGEKEYLEDRGFVIIRLEIDEESQKARLLNRYGVIDKESLCHLSETSLDQEFFNMRINSGYYSPEKITERIIGYLINIGKIQNCDHVK